MPEGKVATTLLLESGILQDLCSACQGSGKIFFQEENRDMPCDGCNASGFRFWRLRRPCPKEHWAGNMPEDCHGVYYPLPPGEDELAGVLLGLSTEFQQHPFLMIAQAYWIEGLPGMVKMFIALAKTGECPHCLAAGGNHDI